MKYLTMALIIMHVRQAALLGILVCPAHEELKDHQADGLAYPEPQRFRRQASVRGLHALFVHDAIEAAGGSDAQAGEPLDGFLFLTNRWTSW